MQLLFKFYVDTRTTRDGGSIACANLCTAGSFVLLLATVVFESGVERGRSGWDGRDTQYYGPPPLRQGLPGTAYWAQHSWAGHGANAALPGFGGGPGDLLLLNNDGQQLTVSADLDLL